MKSDLSVDATTYVPGVWKCARCDFRLVQTNLNGADGTVSARDKPGDKCPNCGTPLWRVSWKEEANEALAIAENQMERAKAAEAEAASLRHKLALAQAVIEPFAGQYHRVTAQEWNEGEVGVATVHLLAAAEFMEKGE